MIQAHDKLKETIDAFKAAIELEKNQLQELSWSIKLKESQLKKLIKLSEPEPKEGTAPTTEKAG